MHRISTVLLVIVALSPAVQAEPARQLPPAAHADAAVRAIAIPDTEPDVTRQVAKILEKLRAGLLAPDELTDNARTAYPASQLQRMAVALGPCNKPPTLELLARSAKGEEHNYRYRARCQPTPLMVEIVFAESGRISHLSVQPEIHLK